MFSNHLPPDWPPDWNRVRSASELSSDYRHRSPETTPLYRIVYHYREELEYNWEQLYQQKHGALRHCVLDALDKYLNCGIIRHGAARAHCPNCNHSILIAFSCKRRGVCPSCAAKRSILFAEHVDKNILLNEPHRHLVFTIPKRLRPYFKYDHKLGNSLFSSAWQTLKQHIGDNPGAIMALHTAGDLLNFHPHIHALVLDGAIDNYGNTTKVPFPTKHQLQETFADCIFQALLDKELITKEIIDNMRSWNSSGFNVFIGDSIPPEDTSRRRFLARYLLKPPAALNRIELIESEHEPVVRYHQHHDRLTNYQDFSPLDFLAELQQHIPDVWEQTTRYYGCYSVRTRNAIGKKRHIDKSETSIAAKPSTEPTDDSPPPSSTWARLIKLIYELNPLSCPKCGENMKIVAFVTDYREINKLTDHLGIPQWRAPPKLQSKSDNQLRFEPFFE